MKIFQKVRYNFDFIQNIFFFAQKWRGSFKINLLLI